MNTGFSDGFIGNLDFSMLSIPSIRLSDIIDIGIVAILIYFVLIWIKNTRGWSLFRGLLIIVAVALLSYRFHFYTLSWLIEKGFSVGIIALMIVFQPELRRILEKVGGTKVTTFAQSVEKSAGNTSVRERAINGIADACQRLHESKTGALIVIERSTKLGDIIEKETTSIINAECEPELFCNIFYNKAPLHDGAVIIRDNRIFAAGCFLPNTQKDQYLTTDLGSRHRAAVGMSENSDALVVVVSEETGNISVALDGQLSRDLSKESLISVLRKYMPGASTEKKKKNRGKK